MQPSRKLLGEVLVERGLLSRTKLKAALNEQQVTKERLGKILIRNGFVRQKAIFAVLHEVAPWALHDESIIFPGVPPALLRDTRTMVTADLGDQVYLATLSTPAVVRVLLEPHLGGREIIFAPANPVRINEYLAKLRSSEDMNPWERMVRTALDKGASDIHILPRSKSFTVLFRIDGVFQHGLEGDLETYAVLASRIKDLSRIDMADRRRAKDGSFMLEHNGRMIDIRVVSIPTTNGEKLVVRLLDPDAMGKTLEELGITRLDAWRKGTSHPHGICLVCGPTGSGKTTTQTATAKEIDYLDAAVYTAEDPVESHIAFAGQVNVNPAVGLDFSGSLRAFMRADPDVILLGEIRDVETARNAIKAGETGHLVLATLHTGSIAGAFARLRDIGVQPYELFDILRSVLVHRLVRTLCTHCAGEGCARCDHQGYKGRTLVSECAYFPDAASVKEAVEGKRTWRTISEDALDKAEQGITDLRELHHVFGAEIEPEILRRHGDLDKLQEAIAKRN